jgi:EmrB/QacA subfamily drug resistance transporter
MMQGQGETGKEPVTGPVKRGAALLVTTLSSFLTPFMAASVTVALPSIQREFNMDALLLNWVATSFLLAAAVFLLPVGRIADIYGRKRIFTYGTVVFTVFSGLCGCAGSGPALLVYRAIQGVGGAMVFGTGIAIVTSVFAPQERGRMLGINIAAVYLGLSLGPFFGGLLIEHLGWRSIFLANVPCGALMVTCILWKLRHVEWAEARGEPLDLVGSVIYGLSLVAIMFGFTRLPALSAGAMTIAGIIGIVLFLKWESRVAHPLFDVALLTHNRVFAFSNLAAFVNYSATFAVTFLLSLYLQYVRGMSPQNTGILLVSQPVVQAFFSPFAGRLSDRVEPRVVASTGMAITVVGLFLFSFLHDTTNLAAIVLGLALLGLGFALFSSPNTNAIMGSVDKKFYGVASGAVATMRILGQMFSMGITVLVFALILGRVKIEPQYYALFMGCVRIIFLIFCFLCLAGVFASLARGKMR